MSRAYNRIKHKKNDEFFHIIREPLLRSYSFYIFNNIDSPKKYFRSLVGKSHKYSAFFKKDYKYTKRDLLYVKNYSYKEWNNFLKRNNNDFEISEFNIEFKKI